jgi:electron transport complex protein RnfC
LEYKLAELFDKLKTFPRGGIHPHGNKFYTKDKQIKTASLPPMAVIPMHQHMGGPAECTVKEGDRVEEGMLIGRASGFFSSNVHASVPGKVLSVSDIYLPNSIKSKAVEIEMEGEFSRLGKTNTKRDWVTLSKEEILDNVSAMGIVGLGGATFPTHIKYKIKKKQRLEFLIINGVECEPYLTCDHRLMLERSDEILEGIKILQKLINPENTIIGIEANKPDAIELLLEKVKEKQLDIKIEALRLKYPQGDEKQLIKALIDREVPSGGLPLDIGAVVSNVGTVFAVYEAVAFEKPLIERFVTVTGSVVKEPGNFKVRIGTKISHLIEECGGFTEIPGKVIVGGPMMGFPLCSLDSPVTKGVSGVIALSKKEAKIGEETGCIQCGSCIKACPFGLNPTRLYKLVEHQMYDEALKEDLMDCKECGCCAYVCPARIPLVQGMKLGKLMLHKKKEKT